MMNDAMEKLYEIAKKENIGIYYWDLGGAKGAAVAGNDFRAVAVDPNQVENTADEVACLFHEIGHIETATLHPQGKTAIDIMRDEYRCMSWVVRNLIPLEELQTAVKSGLTEVWELAEYFCVPEDCILDAVKLYKNKGLL